MSHRLFPFESRSGRTDSSTGVRTSKNQRSDRVQGRREVSEKRVTLAGQDRITNDVRTGKWVRTGLCILGRERTSR